MADEPQNQEEQAETNEAPAEETAQEETAQKQPEAEAQPVNTTKEEPKPAKAVSASLEKIVEQIEKLSVLELADLVHALEDKFGVSASAPVAVAAGGAAAEAAGEPAEEKTTFNVILANAGTNKIGAIKAVR